MVVESSTVTVQQVLRFIRSNKAGRGQVLKLLASEFTKEYVNQVQIVAKPGKK
jgi:hypothetical protein